MKHRAGSRRCSSTSTNGTESMLMLPWYGPKTETPGPEVAERLPLPLVAEESRAALRTTPDRGWGTSVLG